MLRRLTASRFLDAALVGVVIVAVYFNGLGAPFVFDDLPATRDNPTIRSLTNLAALVSPPANSGVGGRPLANVSFAFNHAFGGFHATNVALHVGSAWLLLALIRRTVRGAPAWLAEVGALIWAVHPLTTASVTYVSQRTELLAAFFQLLTLYTFVRGWRVASVVACAGGVLSKEIAAMAPLVVLLYDRTFVAGSFAAAWRERRDYYLALGATWLLAAALLTTGLHHRSVGFGLGVSPFDYALTECRALLLYLKLAVWPSPLVFDYGAIYDSLGLATIARALAVIGALAWTGRELRRGSGAGFVAGSFFLLLAPTSSFVPVAEQPIAENRMYLPLAGLVVAAVVVAQRRLGAAAGVAGLAVLLAFGGLTVTRNATYRSGLALWAETARQRPQNARAAFNHGLALLTAGRAREASVELQRAIALKPGDPKPHHSLGVALLELGRPAEALPHFAEAIRLLPNYARAWANTGAALLATGDAAGASARFETALRLDSTLAEAHHGLGNAEFRRDRPANAIPHYEAALRIDPGLADAHYSCGQACLEVGRVADAVAHFAAATALQPGDVEIRNAHGVALLRAGRVAEAVGQFEHVLRLKPGYQDARDNLAAARAAASRK